ncbi:PD-(D/E)XK nuclease family protein [Halalkalibacter akibai]|uniref:PD-(D/E)XK endonuclease-like domain-containing protein n=1 Tax=Halalkalibacter akibai (strain ATCC 43226 / DSM 21942 / CIP 109018 / JCM 9157 / 1139) TaxID=1236973 RepID=W4QZN8_HALA3|nr:PD-(D/E)XK nuclease family protein [Halalkalibacter akibai]GAE37595.1 hypothetical protein JCM9157_4907 [Halalkalibacter akibai JCM 9157]
MLKIKKEFAWSWSKHKTFINCKRQFLFMYKVAHAGRRKDANAFEQKVNLLNQLTNIDMEFGILVHELIYEAIKRLFKMGIKPNPEQIYQALKNGLNSVYLESLRKRDKWKNGESNGGKMLKEIYYENQVPGERIEVIMEKMDQCTKSFCQSATVEEITKKEIKYDQAERHRSMYLDDEMKINIMIDLSYENTLTGKKTIVDWKTSDYQQIDDFYQLCIYALYHKEVFKINVDNLSIENEYLYVTRQNKHKRSYPLCEGDLDRIKGLIKASYQNITEFLEEQTECGIDENNVMLLPMASNEKSCNRCNFRELCRVEGKV